MRAHNITNGKKAKSHYINIGSFQYFNIGNTPNSQEMSYSAAVYILIFIPNFKTAEHSGTQN